LYLVFVVLSCFQVVSEDCVFRYTRALLRFDNEQDRSPAAEQMYVDELRQFRAYLVEHTEIADLKSLNALGVQFALSGP